jgi:hypothetical protein
MNQKDARLQPAKIMFRSTVMLVLACISLDAQAWMGREGGNGGDGQPGSFTKQRGGVVPTGGPSGVLCWSLKFDKTGGATLFDQRSNFKSGDQPPANFKTSIENLNFTASINDLAPYIEQVSVKIEDTDSGSIASSLGIKRIATIDPAHVENMENVFEVQMESSQTGVTVRFVCEMVNGLKYPSTNRIP